MLEVDAAPNNPVDPVVVVVDEELKSPPLTEATVEFVADSRVELSLFVVELPNKPLVEAVGAPPKALDVPPNAPPDDDELCFWLSFAGAAEVPNKLLDAIAGSAGLEVVEVPFPNKLPPPALLPPNSDPTARN